MMASRMIIYVDVGIGLFWCESQFWHALSKNCNCYFPQKCQKLACVAILFLWRYVSGDIMVDMVYLGSMRYIGISYQYLGGGVVTLC